MKTSVFKNSRYFKLKKFNNLTSCITMEQALEWKTKGNAAFVAKRFDEAVQNFTEAIKLNPTDHVLYSNRAGAYASLQKYDKSLEDASKCISLKPDWAKGYSRKGLAEFQLGNIKAAIETYRKGLKIDPDNAALKDGLQQAEASDPETITKQRMSLMVSSLLRTPKFKKYAEEDADFENRLTTILQEILKDPQNLNLAMAMCPEPRLREALTTLLGLPSKDDSDEACNGFQKSEQTEKKPEPEKKSEEKPKTAEEIEADEWKNKANTLYKQRKFEEALEAYDKAISINPSDITYQTNKAAVYLEMNKFQECLAECQAALDRQYEVRADYTKVAKVYNRMAACYTRMKDYGKAIEMYQKSLLEDNNRHIRAALVEVKRLKEVKDRDDYINPAIAEEHRLKGNEFFKANAFPEAKKEYDEAIRRNPTDAQLYANRAAALMKLLELPMALKDAEKSLELDPTVPKVWARKGNIHSLMKEYNKAITAYQSGLKIDATNSQCRQGLDNVLMKIQETTSSDSVDEEQIKHAMADPEIQALLADPQFCLLLGQISKDPSKLTEALKDPHIAGGIQKLMAAGILKMA